MPDETRKSTKSIGVCIWTVWWDTDTVLQKSYAVIVFEGGGGGEFGMHVGYTSLKFTCNNQSLY